MPEQLVQSGSENRAKEVEADHGPLTQTELNVAGMSCSNCARHVAEALESVPGVASAVVKLEEGRASVRWTGTPNLEAVLRGVKEAGYDATVLAPEAEHACHSDADNRQDAWHLNLLIGVLGTLPLMAGEWVFAWAGQP